ncbi:hypothetical protein E4630_09975 [Aeromonas hydrophila]|nr:hypothetical protein E4625_10190 [Aeromonas hydrophila]QBX75869.1 hypothetical protein E4630_09975 [Aeromonas hydrophila]
MNIFPIQDGASDRHFKGDKTPRRANGDFCANRPCYPTKNPPGRVLVLLLSRDAGPVEEQTLTELRG